MKKIYSNIDTANISERLKQLRISLGFKTAKSFCAEMDIKQTAYNRYEKGSMPQADFLYRLKDKYPDKVDLNWLLYGGDEKEGSDQGLPAFAVAENFKLPLPHYAAVNIDSAGIIKAINEVVTALNRIDETCKNIDQKMDAKKVPAGQPDV